MLPKWLEPDRKDLEQTLPPLRLPYKKQKLTSSSKGSG